MTNFAAPGVGTYTATWIHQGYSGAGNVEALLGSHTGRAALIAGNAEGVFDEWRRAESQYPDAVRIAVNDVGMFLPNLDHWVSGHYDQMAAWKTVRWMHYHGIEKAKLHSCDQAPCVDYVWDQLNPMFALSGHFAMQIAWLMGCAPIILCGCPGSPTRRFFDVRPRDEFGYGGGPYDADRNIQQQVRLEMQRVPAFKAVVRAMSGWSQEFFGGIES